MQQGKLFFTELKQKEQLSLYMPILRQKNTDRLSVDCITHMERFKCGVSLRTKQITIFHLTKQMKQGAFQSKMGLKMIRCDQKLYKICLKQGSRLRLKRSHLRPKILICEWSFCWGRHWRLYIFTCYDLKMCMQCLFSWLFCDHIFCYIHVLNLKLKDDAHQSFSGKRVSNSPRLCRRAALMHTVY